MNVVTRGMPPVEERFPELNAHFPPAGRCLVCGGDDKRHRLWDTILAEIDGGETDEMIAGNYLLPPDAVAAVRRIRPYA